MKSLILVLFNLLIYSFIIFSQETGTFTDQRDGKVYKTVKIGTQTIMSENLSFKPKVGNYWAYNNDQSTILTCGYLYDWETAKKIAPQGWHLPTKEEWETLNNNLGIKSKKVYKATKQGGSSGFNALLVGCRGVNGPFFGVGTAAVFWSATACGEVQAWTFGCYAKDNEAYLLWYFPSCGFSVRLIQD